MDSWASSSVEKGHEPCKWREGIVNSRVRVRGRREAGSRHCRAGAGPRSSQVVWWTSQDTVDQVRTGDATAWMTRPSTRPNLSEVMPFASVTNSLNLQERKANGGVEDGRSTRRSTGNQQAFTHLSVELKSFDILCCAINKLY